MSDLSSVVAFRKTDSTTVTTAQLPVEWYFDPRIYGLETRLLFDAGPNYAGHELLTPNTGDYHTLNWTGDAKVLVRNAQGVSLLDNICRHRQAVMLRGHGTAKNIVCPLHRWTYALDGKLLGAPHFPENPCLDLVQTPLTNWNGLLFAGKRDIVRDLGALGVARDLDFTGFMFDRVEVEEYACNWKTFIEVYLEDYHVEPFHPGLSGFVNVADLKWEFGAWYSVQTCGVKQGLAKPGSDVYRRWHEQVMRHGENQTPAHGAIWLTYFPGLMVEWYPHVLVVSHIIPRGPEACTNVVEFYYPEEIALFEREFIEAEQAAYRETAIEDREICERMTAGRKALYQLGTSDAGPYQSPLEDGMRHFHEFLRREIDPHLSAQSEVVDFTTLIAVSDLAAHLNDAGWIVCDCRHDLANYEAGHNAYAQSHIPGARFLHLDEDLSGPKTGVTGRHPLPHPITFTLRLAALGIDNSKQIVAYDASGGVYAARLWWMLRWVGHTKVAVLDGGFDAWTRESQVVTNALPAVKPARYNPNPNPQLAVGANDIVANLRSGAQRVLDARSPDRFHGENETLDPVAGHIPGAINRFFKLNLSDDGRFKPAQTLRQEFTSLLDTQPPSDLIHQCGSGVTACHNLLAMEVAGLSGSRLFPGSWSEWVSDRTRPIAR